jgi:hypothetical protein
MCDKHCDMSPDAINYKICRGFFILAVLVILLLAFGGIARPTAQARTEGVTPISSQ